jgi:hypothetical protein
MSVISNVWDAVIARQPEPDLSTRIAARNLGQPADLAELLPAPAREKFTALRETLEDIRFAIHAEFDAVQEAAADKQKAAGRVAELTDPGAASRMGSGRIYAEDHPSVIEARSRFDRESAQYARLAARHKARGQRAQELGRLVESVESYLKSAGTAIEPFTGKVKKAASVDAARKDIEALQTARAAVIAAPHLSAAAKARMRADVERMAMAGAPNVKGCLRGDPIRWPKQTAVVETNGMLYARGKDGSLPVVGRATVELPDTQALLMWANRDAIVAALDREIDSQADDTNALDDGTRATRLAEIDAAILDAERSEVVAVEAAGGEHREDVSILALLNISGPAPRPTWG